MTYEQKIQACQAVGEFSLCMRRPGDWYVDHAVEMKDTPESALLCVTYGNGATPEDAVEDHWKILTAPAPMVIVLHADRRRLVHWNGFMWQDIAKPSLPPEGR